MEPAEYLPFIEETEKLKNVLRTSWTSAGRRESTAEHSWRLALLAGLLMRDRPELDGQKVLLMALVHDLGEVYEGDVSAALRPDPAAKCRAETAAVNELAGRLAPPLGKEFLSLWREYEDQASPEARFVKALDRAETILQHNQGRTPQGFDYAFNLEYGKEYFQGDPQLAALRRVLDAGTRARMNEE